MVRVSAAEDNFIAFSRRPTCAQTMDGLRYAAGQNRYVYAMSAACRSSRGTLSALRQLPTRPLKFFRCSLARARDNKAASKPVIMKLTVHSHVRCLLSEKAHRYLNISRRFEATLPFYPLYKASNEKTRVPAQVFFITFITHNSSHVIHLQCALQDTCNEVCTSMTWILP